MPQTRHRSYSLPKPLANTYNTRNAYSLSHSPKNSLLRKTCKNITSEMKNIRLKVVKETKQFSKKIKEEVSCMKIGFMKKMKKYNEKMKSLQKQYLERCRNIEFVNSSSSHDSAMKFTEDEYETFSKYFTTHEINELMNK